MIVGGGFAGLSAARKLRNAPVHVTLIDRYAIITCFSRCYIKSPPARFSPANIAAPLRNILETPKKHRGAACGGNRRRHAQNHRVVLSDGSVEYDTLIVATGARHQYFGHDDWEKFAPGLKNVDDATHMRRQILLAFEAAEREPDPQKLRAWMTFVIVGGGPTGVELAGALGEIANDTLRNDFRNITPSEARIILVEGTDRILPAYPPKLSQSAKKMVEHLGVTVRTGALVTDVAEGSVTIREGDKLEQIPTRTILWAAGVLGSPLGRIVAEATGAQLDKAGRVVVQPDLTVSGHPEIFVLGDLANFSHQTGKPLPGVAQPAIQQGRYVADVITRRLRGVAIQPFHYNDRGNLATIGRGAAVADLNWLHLTGVPAWLIWIFIHLANIVQFQDRLLVFLQWAWLYISYDRSARLITGDNPLPLDL